MEDPLPFRFLLARRARRLTHLLVVSVTLNVAFLVTIFYTGLREQSFTKLLLREKKREEATALKPLSPKIAEILPNYLCASFEELTALLADNTHIEQGQLRCDLALACLVARYAFDVERALSGMKIETRDYAFQDPSSDQWVRITLFSGLSRDRRVALCDFARRELWPLTAKGLFLAIQKEQQETPLSLKQTFFHTLEFYTIYRALYRWMPHISHDTLLKLLIRTHWPLVSSLSAELVGGSEQKKERLARFFVELLGQGCHQAAAFLIDIDPTFAFHHLNDDELNCLIDGVDELAPQVEAFLMELEGSLRSQEIKRRAKAKLVALKEKEQAPSYLPLPAQESEPIAPMATYVVQFGDTLWKISRRFRVTLNALRELNELHSDVLIPGKILFIPASKPKSVIAN